MSKLAQSIEGRLTMDRRGRLVLDGKVTNFYLTEWVSRREYKLRGKYAILHLDPNTIGVAQALREDFAVSLTLNNWYNGGKRQQSGFRSAYTSVGSDTSAHRFGLGGDMISRKMTANEMRRVIMDNQQRYLDLGMTRIEHEAYAPNWLHFDLFPTGLKNIRVIKPA